MSDIGFSEIKNGDGGNIIRNTINSNFTKANNQLSEIEKRLDSCVKVIKYTGDGTEKRLLLVGFTPKFALVFSTSSNIRWAFKTGHGSEGYSGVLSASWKTSYNCANDGVYVGTKDSCPTNRNNEEYIAICWQ